MIPRLDLREIQVTSWRSCDEVLARWCEDQSKEATVEYHFDVVAADLVRAVVAFDLPMLQHALDDSIGTRPPRGAPQGGPSTYWIDAATQGLRARLSQSSDEPFASGNITYLRLVGAEVVAGYDYAPDEEGDAVGAQDFLELLIAWREATVDLNSASVGRLPPPSKAIPL